VATRRTNTTKMAPNPTISLVTPPPFLERALNFLRENSVGQPEAIEEVWPAIEQFQADLNPLRRPAGIFLLLGPTGTGKTHFVETLAEALHGDPRLYTRVDCGEYQMDHEVAKLIGAPPGYLGHRETRPALTQASLNDNTSQACRLSVLLFDEIEKASAALRRLLLGVMDKAALKLGDATSVNFENTLIFMTSNVGSAELATRLRTPGFIPVVENSRERKSIATEALKRDFAPEFLNRVDSPVVFRDLTHDAFRKIVHLQLGAMQRQFLQRRGPAAPLLTLTPEAVEWFVENGFSHEYGARPLKRLLNRTVARPLAQRLTQDLPARKVHIHAEGGDLVLEYKT
jgi:ATP-dependent Clp protease ATP-binding subunit ClpA